MTFDQAVAFVLAREGGYSNDPMDPGGETNYGISKRNFPSEDIKNMTQDRAKQIYKAMFWDKLYCDSLPDIIRLPIFDCSVNQGLPTAAKILQGAVGAVQDGIIGPQTVAKCQAASPSLLLIAVATARIKKYLDSSSFDRFGKGWVSRVIGTLGA